MVDFSHLLVKKMLQRKLFVDGPIYIIAINGVIAKGALVGCVNQLSDALAANDMFVRTDFKRHVGESVE